MLSEIKMMSMRLVLHEMLDEGSVCVSMCEDITGHEKEMYFLFIRNVYISPINIPWTICCLFLS